MLPVVLVVDKQAETTTEAHLQVALVTQVVLIHQRQQLADLDTQALVAGLGRLRQQLWADLAVVHRWPQLQAVKKSFRILTNQFYKGKIK
jgi:hypothetical protein